MCGRAVAFLRAVYLQGFAKAVAITAPTGIAATHIGGTTIHSAMGVGVPQLHEDFASRMGSGGPAGRGKQIAVHLQARADRPPNWIALAAHGMALTHMLSGSL